MKDDNILEVSDLSVRFFLDEGTVNAVNGVSYSLPFGKSIGIVGESGCGKTVSSYAILRLLPKIGRIVSGEIKYRKKDGEVIDLLDLAPNGKEIRRIRGKEISMIFQEPMSSFSPVRTICDQISEALVLHCDMNKNRAKERTIELLELVGIPKPSKRVNDYPFQFSGGMRQRAMIAMALARNPRVLIADEPTTALDVTLQAQILRLIRDMQEKFNLSMVLITHDLGVVAHMVDYVYIMYLGTVVESGPVKEIFNNPQHPYTRALLKSIPRLSDQRGEKIFSIRGSVPSTYSLPKGCFFHPRCDYFMKDKCNKMIPDNVKVDEDHYVKCHLYTGEGKEDVGNV